MKIKSIQSKFIILITSALLILSLFIGGFSLINTNKLLKEDSALMMNAVCTEQALRLDLQLQRIEQAVDTIYNYAQDELVSVEKIKESEFRQEYLKKIERLSLDIANKTEGSRTVYLRVNPELSDYCTGFFWVKKHQNSDYVENEITDLSKYDRDDTEHVGWYYEPMEAKAASWLSPYHNQNIDIEMVSYVIPIYRDGIFVGVVGMDIDFTLFIDLAQSAAVYENGRANLIDLNTRKIYYREKEDDDVTVRSSEITDKLYNDLIEKKSSGDELTFYKSTKHDFMVSFQTVRNGMKYILYAPVGEINQKRNSLLMTIVFVTLRIMILFIFFTVYETRKIVRPLRSLTEVSSQIAAGDWDVDIDCSTRDEIYTLTNSIKTMAAKLKKYVAEVNKLAYKDGLTGVKNKTCYNDYVKMLSEDCGDIMRSYAVVIFDVNNLKVINDNYGHETGDTLLVAASSYICRTFSHSPVFRIGGDEFVAILEGEDFENRYKLLEKFEINMKDNVLDVEPYAAIMIAFGMAEHSNELDSFDDVFRQADWNMYEKKKSMKNE